MDKMEEQILELYHENAVLRTKIDTLEQEIENIKKKIVEIKQDILYY